MDDDFVPPPVYDFISPEEISEINALGMPIYVGSNPPYSEGTFAMDSLAIHYDDAGDVGAVIPQDIVIADNYYDFNVSLCEYNSDSSSSMCTTQAYISGTRDCFTIFGIAIGQTGECEHDDVRIYSGCFDRYGDMINFYKAFFSIAQSGDCDALPPVGHLQIQAEIDGFSEWIE